MIEIISTEGFTFMCRQFRKSAAALCSLALCWAVMANASTCSGATIIGTPALLSTLLTPGGTIVAGDKTFTNFQLLFTGDMPPPTAVNVAPIIDDLGNFGIQLQGFFVDLPSSPGGSDFKLSYVVTAGAGRLISDAHLAGNPNLMGSTGTIGVTETFLPLGANGEFTMDIYDDEGQANPKLMDSVVFTTPTKSLNVQKDIGALVPAGGMSATMSFVDQTFSQINIPEPTAGLLIACAGVGLGMARRRSGAPR